MCKRPGARHKFSTNLPTIWSHVLDRSTEVQNKLIIPLSVLHTFFHSPRWKVPVSSCLLATGRLDNSAGHWGEAEASPSHALTIGLLRDPSQREGSLRFPVPDGRLDTSTDQGR